MVNPRFPRVMRHSSFSDYKRYVGKWGFGSSPSERWKVSVGPSEVTVQVGCNKSSRIVTSQLPQTLRVLANSFASYGRPDRRFRLDY